MASSAGGAVASLARSLLPAPELLHFAIAAAAAERENSLDNPQRQRDEYMGSAIEDYERAIAARSEGLVRGRAAWNDGRECWLVDFPLVVLVVNRMRTPAARRFRTAALEQSLVLLSGREDVQMLPRRWIDGLG